MDNNTLSKFTTMSQKATLIIISCLLALATADDNGKNHHRDEKPPKVLPCGENERFAKSGIDCLNCDNYKNTTCPIVKEKKCYCIEGFVRDYQNKCINKTECPTACKAHEHYTNTTPCEYTCDGKDQHIPEHCNCSLPGGCVCDKGYVRCEQTHSCVPEDDCYPKCQEHEEPSKSPCQPYCEKNKVVHPFCPLIILPCKTTCICCSGYIRVGKCGRCIPIEECIGKTTTDAASTSTDAGSTSTQA